MPNEELKDKARRLVFNSGIRDFPVMLEMYVMAFKLDVDLDQVMGEILSLIRTSKDAATAYQLLCHYLDGLE